VKFGFWPDAAGNFSPAAGAETTQACQVIRRNAQTGGFPSGMPGMGELIDGAVQQAPQPGRQETGSVGEGMADGCWQPSSIH